MDRPGSATIRSLLGGRWRPMGRNGPTCCAPGPGRCWTRCQSLQSARSQ
jgi:hypothetical protein